MATVTSQSMAWSSMPGLAPIQQHYSYAQPSSHHQHSQPSSPHRAQHQTYYHHNTAPTSSTAVPSYRIDSAPRMPFDTLPPTSTSSAATSYRGSYETYASTTYHSSADPHMRAHSLEGLYTSQQLPAKKRTRSKMYPSEQARQAAKLIQKARRREQNRNAQRRLRDRKEEHIFKVSPSLLPSYDSAFVVVGSSTDCIASLRGVSTVGRRSIHPPSTKRGISHRGFRSRRNDSTPPRPKVRASPQTRRTGCYNRSRNESSSTSSLGPFSTITPQTHRILFL